MASDHSEFRAFVRRILRAYGRRVSDADPEDLADLLNIRADVDQAIDRAVLGLRAQGHSWATIGAATGMSRQAAFKRWGESVNQQLTVKSV